MSIHFVVNPIAGRGRTRRSWPGLERTLPSDLAYTVGYTERAGDGTRLAQEGLRSGASRIVAVGGDGTVSECAAAMLDSGVPLGFVPTGSACDLAHSIGLPRDLPGALRLALHGEPRGVDVGVANGRTFLNVAGVGLDAQVAHRVNENRSDAATGKWLYIKALLSVLRTYRPTPMRFDLDGLSVEGKVLLAAIGNAQYYGGGMRIVPTAQLTDGYLDVLIVGDLSVAGTLGLLTKVFSGRHRFHPKVALFRCREICVQADRPLPVHVDGEATTTTPLCVQVRGGAVQMAAPVPHLETVGPEPQLTRRG